VCVCTHVEWWCVARGGEGFISLFWSTGRVGPFRLWRGGVICIREEASHHPWFGAGAVLVGRGARGRCVGFSPTLGLNQPGKIVGGGEGTSGENRAKE